MAWLPDPRILDALAGSCQMSAVLDITQGDEKIAENVPISDGSVTAQLSSRVTHNASIGANIQQIQKGYLDPRTQWGHIRMQVSGYPDIPLMSGRIFSHTTYDNGAVSMSLLGPGEDVLACALEEPWSAVPKSGIPSVMAAMIRQVDENFTVDITQSLDAPVPDLTFEEDRGYALDQMAQGINCIWQETRTGGFIIYANPYLFPDAQVPVLTLTDEVIDSSPKPVILSGSRTVSRDSVYNSVTVVVERTDGTTPKRITARDIDPNSTTFYGGLFGKRSRVIRAQTAEDIQSAYAVASRALRQSIALTRTWTVDSTYGYLLDPGDVVLLHWKGENAACVVEAVTYQLLPNIGCNISLRELVATPGNLS